VELLQSITLSPKFFPLTLAITRLDDSSLILATAGTKSIVQIYVSKDNLFDLAATLTGHEGWIRSLTFSQEQTNGGGDLLLASASQDKYVRLWRVHQGDELPAVSSVTNGPALGVLGKSLSNKAHRIQSKLSKYSITFEALLLGHEDWIYSASWCHNQDKLQLLSTSADNSLAIWEPDPTSGVWICAARLGEISAQKGSTSATGSTGGFWIGLWSPDGSSVVHWVEPGVGDYGSTYHRRIGGHSRLLSVVTLEMSRDYVGPRMALICYQRVLIKRPDSMLNGDEEANVLGMSSRGLKFTDMTSTVSTLLVLLNSSLVPTRSYFESLMNTRCSKPARSPLRH